MNYLKRMKLYKINMEGGNRLSVTLAIVHRVIFYGLKFICDLTIRECLSSHDDFVVFWHGNNPFWISGRRR